MKNNDYLYSYHSAGLYYDRVPSFVYLGDGENCSGFASIYSVTKQTAEAIHEAGTTAAYKGIVWSERIWIDVDTKGLSVEAAVEKLTLTQNRLQELGLDFVVYDSGGHPTVGGGHFGVLRDAAPSHLLPARDRAWVKRHFSDVADLSIYTHLHLFRLPGTKHEITGRVKELVGEQRGKVLTLPPYKREEAGEAQFEVVGTSESSIFSNFNIMANIGPRKNGERHLALVRLAFELRDHGVGPAQAYWLLQQNNLTFSEPKGDEEIQKIIKDTYRGQEEVTTKGQVVK